MPKMRRKTDLPKKLCRQCGREMVWRKAWAKNWTEVLYCSDRCRVESKRERGAAASTEGPLSSTT